MGVRHSYAHPPPNFLVFPPLDNFLNEPLLWGFAIYTSTLIVDGPILVSYPDPYETESYTLNVCLSFSTHSWPPTTPREDGKLV